MNKKLIPILWQVILIIVLLVISFLGVKFTSFLVDGILLNLLVFTVNVVAVFCIAFCVANILDLIKNIKTFFNPPYVEKRKKVKKIGF